jgi:ABC-type multidrug transport system ATPase subunit
LPGASAFVPEEDLLHGFFTVDSYLRHYARLAGLNLTANALDDKIENLLADLGLVEQRNTIVGDVFLKGLSGGQKRRLSICLEALTDPCNFFLDEPTSGLDAESAFQVMAFLKNYVQAAAGRRVILTIHQPNSFIWKSVGNVILLSKGQLMYEGPRSSMEDFFTSNGHPTPKEWNPADHYVTMVNDEFRNHALGVEEWSRRFSLWESSHPSFIPENLKSGVGGAPQVETRRVGGLTAIRELTYRYNLNLWFNPGILLTRVAMYTMLGTYLLFE